MDGVTGTCEQCGRAWTSPDRRSWRRRFCDQACKDRYRQAHQYQPVPRPSTCKTCQGPIDQYRPLPERLVGLRLYCSPGCVPDQRRLDRHPVLCLGCAGPLPVPSPRGGSVRIFCSQKCSTGWRARNPWARGTTRTDRVKLALEHEDAVAIQRDRARLASLAQATRRREAQAITSAKATFTAVREVAADGSTWRERAACSGHDPDLWFAEDTTTALDVCGGCPVAAQCLAWARVTGQQHGVWGGMDLADLRTAKRTA